MARKRAFIYIDGFNLYYGCLRNTPYRWLNIVELSKKLVSDKIEKVHYFTARVSARAGDPMAPLRQKIYLRALETLPEVQIHYGHFLTHVKWMPKADNPQERVKVVKTDEKGSDVNLASQILADAFRGQFDTAAVISNDSDLLKPIFIVKEELKKTVGIVNPQKDKRFAVQLSNIASFKRVIREAVLQVCQFPPTLTDSKGTFHKPESW